MGETDIETLSEENYLKQFFRHLSTFSWDKAKEFVEKKQKLIPLPLQVWLYKIDAVDMHNDGVVIRQE